jgi:hypothetical protein
VIDPARLSVEALAFDAIPGGAASITGASVALRDGTRLEARLEGIGSQLKGGAIPVRLNLTSVSRVSLSGSRWWCISSVR